MSVGHKRFSTNSQPQAKEESSTKNRTPSETRHPGKPPAALQANSIEHRRKIIDQLFSGSRSGSLSALKAYAHSKASKRCTQTKTDTRSGQSSACGNEFENKISASRTSSSPPLHRKAEHATSGPTHMSTSADASGNLQRSVSESAEVSTPFPLANVDSLPISMSSGAHSNPKVTTTSSSLNPPTSASFKELLASDAESRVPLCEEAHLAEAPSVSPSAPATLQAEKEAPSATIHPEGQQRTPSVVHDPPACVSAALRSRSLQFVNMAGSRSASPVRFLKAVPTYDSLTLPLKPGPDMIQLQSAPTTVPSVPLPRDVDLATDTLTDHLAHPNPSPVSSQSPPDLAAATKQLAALAQEPNPESVVSPQPSSQPSIDIDLSELFSSCNLDSVYTGTPEAADTLAKPHYAPESPNGKYERCMTQQFMIWQQNSLFNSQSTGIIGSGSSTLANCSGDASSVSLKDLSSFSMRTARDAACRPRQTPADSSACNVFVPDESFCVTMCEAAPPGCIPEATLTDAPPPSPTADSAQLCNPRHHYKHPQGEPTPQDSRINTEQSQCVIDFDIMLPPQILNKDFARSQLEVDAEIMARSDLTIDYITKPVMAPIQEGCGSDLNFGNQQSQLDIDLDIEDLKYTEHDMSPSSEASHASPNTPREAHVDCAFNPFGLPPHLPLDLGEGDSESMEDSEDAEGDVIDASGVAFCGIHAVNMQGVVVESSKAANGDDLKAVPLVSSKIAKWTRRWFHRTRKL